MATSTRYGVYCDVMTTSKRLSSEVRDGVIVFDSDLNQFFKVSNGAWKNINSLQGYVFVSSKSDLPSAIDGVITLEANQTYFFTTDVDLLGHRLVASQDTVILGASSENASITSTGLAGTDLNVIIE